MESANDNTCVCCGRIIPEGGHICLACGDYDDMQTFRPSSRAHYPEPPKVTNGDRIRSMVDDEDLLYAVGTSCNRCAYAEGRNGDACGVHCWEGNMEWLRSEVRNE